MQARPGAALDAFADIIRRLRGEGGCPWDREQTHRSLKKNLLEETYEVLHAIDSSDDNALRDELGDVLLQVVFHADIAASEGRFTLTGVIEGAREKMVRRHPHVFGEASANDAKEVLSRWEMIKREEGGAKKRLMEVNPNLPALMLAQKAQEKAARVGFGFSGIKEAGQKLADGVSELMSAETGDGFLDELGDILFSAVSLARLAGADAEDIMRRAAGKFMRRVNRMEESMIEDGRDWDSFTASELDELWRRAGQSENSGD